MRLMGDESLCTMLPDFLGGKNHTESKKEFQLIILDNLSTPYSLEDSLETPASTIIHVGGMDFKVAEQNKFSFTS